jgi:Domain of unknown function (DUF4157)
MGSSKCQTDTGHTNGSFVPPSTFALQRKCACGQHSAGGECEGCKKKTLQRQHTREATSATAPPIVHDVLRSPGHPLDTGARKFFESQFQHDFSGVRLHSDARAAASANAVNAVAYTVGSNIVLGSGQGSPQTSEGRSLLAHELTHVVQQSRSTVRTTDIRIAPASDPAEREAESIASQPTRAETDGRENLYVSHGASGLQRQGKPGTSTYQETPTINPPNPKTPGITEGSVEREEFGDQHAFLGRAKVNLQFDENTCQVKIPLKVQYREPVAADFAQCPVDKGEKPTAMPKGKGRKIFEKYLSVVNRELNGWFAARLESCPGQKCADKKIGIQVEVTETTSDPDYTFAVVNAKGRSCVQQMTSFTRPGNVVLVGEDNETTYAHEGSHMTLGHGDEYGEAGTPKERVREDDFSLLANSEGYRGWSVLHQRHFAFVPAFLKAALKGPGGKPCEVKLEELSRPTKLDFKISASVGYVNLAGSPGEYLSGGFSLGYAPGLRGTRLDLGARFTFLGGLDRQERMAFLLGLRLGIEKRFTPSSGGFRLGAFAEGGGANVSAARQPSAWRPYGEGGVSLGYGLAPMGGVIISLFAEAAAGTTLDTKDPNNINWFRTGIGAGFEF